ncbi:MAG: exosortase/archaeosortase family protein [Pseudomonadota bacterium]
MDKLILSAPAPNADNTAPETNRATKRAIDRASLSSMIDTASRTSTRRYGLFVVALCIAMMGTLHDMASIWLSSTAYLHGALAAPAAYFLIATTPKDNTQDTTVGQASKPAYSAALVVSLCAILVAWLWARAGGVALFQQFAFVGALIVGYGLFLGAARLKENAAALAFLLFMPPLGDGLLWPMQVLTARVAEMSLTLFGFTPVREGVLIHVGEHAFAVTEACAGLRLLTAMMMAGFFIAASMPASMPAPTHRRMAIAGLAIALGFVANWVRVISLIAFTALTEDRYGVAEDHFTVGVVIFILALTILLAVARSTGKHSQSVVSVAGKTLAARSNATNERRNITAIENLAMAAVLSAGLYSTIIVEGAKAPTTPQNVKLTASAAWLAGPQQVAAAADPNRLFVHADSEQIFRYTDGQRRIEVTLGVFAPDRPGAEAAGYDTRTAIDDRLTLPTSGMNSVKLQRAGGKDLTIWMRENASAGFAATRLFVLGPNIKTTPSEYALALAGARLTGRRMTSGVLLATASGADATDAAAALQSFLSELRVSGASNVTTHPQP